MISLQPANLERSALPNWTVHLGLSSELVPHCVPFWSSSSLSIPTTSSCSQFAHNLCEQSSVCDQDSTELIVTGKSPNNLVTTTSGSMDNAETSGIYLTPKLDSHRLVHSVQDASRRPRSNRMYRQTSAKESTLQSVTSVTTSRPAESHHLGLRAHSPLSGQSSPLCCQTNRPIAHTMSRTSVSDLLVCDGCRGPIQDQLYLCVGNQPWHAACLQCHVCGQNLQWEKTCFFRRGAVFCRVHYERMLRCLYCDERFQVNDSIYKIDAFFAYHRDCLRCASCCRLLQIGDAFLLNLGSAYCVTQRTQMGQSRNASCWLQVTSNTPPVAVTRVYVTNGVQTLVRPRFACETTVDRTTDSVPLQGSRKNGVSMSIIQPFDLGEPQLNDMEEKNHKTQVSFPLQEKSASSSRAMDDTENIGTRRELPCPISYFSAGNNSDLARSSDGFLPAVQRLISSPEGTLDSMSFLRSNEGNVDTSVSKSELERQTGSINGEKCSIDEQESKTGSDVEFTLQQGEPGIEVLAKDTHVRDEYQSNTGPVKRARSMGRDKPNRDSKGKRIRTSFKHQQLQMMKAFFEVTRNPDSKDLKQLSAKTGLSKRVLQVWFQNARAKYRRTHNAYFQSQTCDSTPDIQKTVTNGDNSPVSPNGALSQPCSDAHSLMHPAESIRSDSSQPSLGDMDSTYNLYSSDYGSLTNQPLLPIPPPPPPPLPPPPPPHPPLQLPSPTSSIAIRTCSHSAAPASAESTKPWVSNPSTLAMNRLNSATETISSNNYDVMTTTQFSSYLGGTCGIFDPIVGFTHGSSLSASFDTASSASPPSQFFAIDELTDQSTFYLVEPETMVIPPIYLQQSKPRCGPTDVR